MTKNLKNKNTDKATESLTTLRLLLFSFIIALFVIYPNLSIVKVERAYLGEAKHTAHLIFFTIRYIYFSALIWLLIKYNIQRIKSPSLWKRILHALIISVLTFVIYLVISRNLNPKKEWFEGLVVFQFLVMSLICSLIGHVYHLYAEKRKTEHEMELLKIENLQSRYDALTNQINPHFFFNSLNGLTSLIRKKNDENTLAYVNKLSDVFRYILQSDKKVLVTLDEELNFVQSFRYMLEVRFANKLDFTIEVDPAERNLKIPVLSLLPLIENIVVHNIIDSDHRLEVRIRLNENRELVISNPVYPKLTPPDTNSTGLKNLESRFLLLMNKNIRIENDGKTFTVYLPLKEE